MDSIKDVLGQYLEELHKKQLIREKDNPEVLLKKVLTKREIRHIKFNYFKAGVLGVFVDSSSWLYYFGVKKDALIKQMQQYSNIVKDIRFSLGEFR